VIASEPIEWLRLDRIGHYKVRLGTIDRIDRIVNSDAVFPLLDCRRNELWGGFQPGELCVPARHEDFRKDTARRFQTLAVEIVNNLKQLLHKHKGATPWFQGRATSVSLAEDDPICRCKD
jgi:hypothetical protein